ncbi:fatty acid/phospholipid synthesis protein PlsX [Metamycoplasma arthritidis]|uniref:Phosphate acyltransferase n=1 Tax=Metamycoplasma arthritidis (strain 158L3-1) TaxID=243272 RepID=B3PN91_META1|nr:phosphate acyltransferase PlsX [Metamycoplasma arthritidis]ACF07493.1 fatty acid/phospholipid synthesis protein [Metamycoplasma arthritidis 158L3-1]VEU79014.1 fatty acid/phospholipid synthesis protein PlsX [Metamycoplasma arthritidis]
MDKKIIFDLLNSDGGETLAILAAKKFAHENPNYKLLLVGNQESINNIFKNNLPENIEIVHSPKLLHKTDNPREILREESSMLSAFNLLKEDKGSAILSSGDSGSFLTLSALKVNRISGVLRPSFMPIMPSTNGGHFLLTDVGANVDVKPEYLVEWAKIAVEYHKLFFKTEGKQKLAILNIGTEDYKGPEVSREANKMLMESKNSFDYIGFIEPRDIIDGKADIVISDGYAGNIFLKTMESSFLAFGKMLKSAIHKNIITKIGGLLLKKPLKAIKNKFDYHTVGGAFIIGPNKVVVKAHGSSDELAFYSALKQIKRALDENIIEKVERAIKGDE